MVRELNEKVICDILKAKSQDPSHQEEKEDCSQMTSRNRQMLIIMVI